MFKFLGLAENCSILCFPHWTIFWDFLAYWGGLFWKCPSLKILPGGRGVVGCLGSPENARGKGPGFDSRCGAPVQHILRDIDDDDEDDEHEGAHKDDEYDKDDENQHENEDKDEFEDDKG